MGWNCCMKNCSTASHHRRGENRGAKIVNGLTFHRIPTWKQCESSLVSEVTKRRRVAWLSAVRRADYTFNNVPEHARVCSRHFHSGQPAYEMKECNPDWAPSLHLGHSDIKPSGTDRFARRSKREHQKRIGTPPAVEETAQPGAAPMPPDEDGEEAEAAGETEVFEPVAQMQSASHPLLINLHVLDESDLEFSDEEENEEDEISVDIDHLAEMEKIRNFDCKCEQRRKENSERQPVSCSQKLSPDLIYETRMDMASLSKDHRDMLLLGIIKTCMNDSEMTQSSKKVSRKREFHKSKYMVHTVVVCRATFCFVYGISKTLLQALVQSYKENGGALRQKKKGPAVDNIAVDTNRLAEMEKIRKFDCKCQQRRKENSVRQPVSCSKKLSPELIYETRMDKASLPKDHRDMLLLGILKTCMNDSEMTQSSKKVPSKRKFCRSTYMVHTIVICRATFQFVYGISKCLTQALLTSYKENGGVPRRRKTGPRMDLS